MSLAKYCAVHEDRPAIGVCIITQRPVCAACSTPYKGVNYSKEGLKVLLERERGEQESLDRPPLGLVLLMVAAFPACLLLTLGFWFGAGLLIIDMVQDARL